jgi:hypothetical protein
VKGVVWKSLVVVVLSALAALEEDNCCNDHG